MKEFIISYVMNESYESCTRPLRGQVHRVATRGSHGSLQTWYGSIRSWKIVLGSKVSQATSSSVLFIGVSRDIFMSEKL